jgi:hypothetical protein
MRTAPARTEWLSLCGMRMALWLIAAPLGLAGVLPSVAAARGFVSLHFGVPLVVGPPVYYAPPPIYFAPPPAYYIQPPSPTSVATTAPPSRQTCHEYKTTATIDGKPRPVVGTACLQPDGTWQITR